MQTECCLQNEERECICENCAKNLRLVRAYLGWRQEELAKATGTTHRRISEIETGKAKMSWTLYLALVAILSIHPKTKDSFIYEMFVTDNTKKFITIK